MDFLLLLNRNDPDLPSSREGISLNLFGKSGAWTSVQSCNGT